MLSSKPPMTAAIDAVWFARGGYGAGRVGLLALDRLNDIAAQKTYLGYSDAGALLAGLYARGFPNVVHGPMPADLNREGGEEAIKRSLAYLVSRDPASLEPAVSVQDACGRFQHHDPLAPHRHVVPARSQGPRPDARRGLRIHVSDRPGAAAHHQQHADPGRGGDQARPLQRDSRPTIPISAKPRRTSRGIGAKSRALPISAAPISATTSPTRSCPSAVFVPRSNTVA